MESPTEDGMHTPESPSSPLPQSPVSSLEEKAAASPPSVQAPRLPQLRTASDSANPIMNPTSTPLGALNAARRPTPNQPPSAAGSMRASGLPQDMQAKMKAFHLSRQGAPPAASLRSGSTSSVPTSTTNTPNVPVVTGVSVPGGIVAPSPSTPAGALAGGIASMRLPPNGRPQAPNWASAPSMVSSKSPKPGLGARRGMKLPGGLPGASPTASVGLPGINGDKSVDCGELGKPKSQGGSLFNKFSDFVDTKSGTLKFAGKAVIHGKGIDFSSGSSFSISLDEVDNLEELGKGNYGTVYKVRHSRPHMRRPGLGLKGNIAPPSISTSAVPQAKAMSPDGTDPVDKKTSESDPSTPKSPTFTAGGGTTGIIMAMKEIRLELDEAKFAAIIMELDILHRCVSPFIIDFYGAFFQEGAVYICMEYMDGGSIDKLYGDGIPEGVLRKVTLSTVMGLKSLKEDHNIIHRDVKPTNILVNTKGQVKICDFGVSGNLVASIAKTNIGCQSYMAPERISNGGVASAGAGGGTYSVQSDVWSLGLSIIECAMGRYPYPPETYNNIFSQLNAIVEGEPPSLPEKGYSPEARDFTRSCLNKTPKLRPTYAMLQRHPWLAPLLKPPTEPASPQMNGSPIDADHPITADKEVADWAIAAIEARRSGKMGKKDPPPLHAAPLDTVVSPGKDKVGDGYEGDEVREKLEKSKEAKEDEADGEKVQKSESAP